MASQGCHKLNQNDISPVRDDLPTKKWGAYLGYLLQNDGDCASTPRHIGLPHVLKAVYEIAGCNGAYRIKRYRRFCRLLLPDQLSDLTAVAFSGNLRALPGVVLGFELSA